METLGAKACRVPTATRRFTTCDVCVATAHISSYLFRYLTGTVHIDYVTEARVIQKG